MAHRIRLLAFCCFCSSGALPAQEPAAPPFYANRTKLLHWLDETGESHPIILVSRTAVGYWMRMW